MAGKEGSAQRWELVKARVTIVIATGDTKETLIISNFYIFQIKPTLSAIPGTTAYTLDSFVVYILFKKY